MLRIILKKIQITNTNPILQFTKCPKRSKLGLEYSSACVVFCFYSVSTENYLLQLRAYIYVCMYKQILKYTALKNGCCDCFEFCSSYICKLVSLTRLYIINNLVSFIYFGLSAHLCYKNVEN